MNREENIILYMCSPSKIVSETGIFGDPSIIYLQSSLNLINSHFYNSSRILDDNLPYSKDHFHVLAATLDTVSISGRD